jgi:hypothetical protein
VRLGRVAAGLAAAVAGTAAVARKRRRAGELVEIRYDDGAAVKLDEHSSAREALLAPAREAIAAVRG